MLHLRLYLNPVELYNLVKAGWTLIPILRTIDLSYFLIFPGYEFSNLLNTFSNCTLKGVVKNWLGHQGSVAEMVNKLCLGLVDYGSYYNDIATSLSNHYDNCLNRSVATLRRVYFKDLWTGTATIAAVVILVLTLIGTVASVLQVLQNDDKFSSAPPPARGP